LLTQENIYFYLILKRSLNIPGRYERVGIDNNEREMGLILSRKGGHHSTYSAKETNISALKIHGDIYWID
jgi:hypothetical protein